jgi:hypothetical protein
VGAPRGGGGGGSGLCLDAAWDESGKGRVVSFGCVFDCRWRRDWGGGWAVVMGFLEVVVGEVRVGKVVRLRQVVIDGVIDSTA